METNIALVVLIGLPGAGKSSLCDKILSIGKTNAESIEYEFIHVCYDRLIPLSTQRQYAEARIYGNEEEMDCWKVARREIFTNVDKLVDSLKSGNNTDSVLKVFNVECASTRRQDTYFVILLDDNFYYRSMRYEYYQLARKHTIGFMQVHVNCSTEVAIKQNLSRGEEQVPTSVILNMSQKLQKPKPGKNGWEALIYAVSADNFDDIVGFWDTLEACLMAPVQPIETNEQEKEESRKICSRSVAHQTDLFLRSLVGRIIKDARTNGTNKTTDLSSFSSCVNAIRQSVMDAVKKGALLFPPDVAEAIDDTNRELFESFIESEFQKLL